MLHPWGRHFIVPGTSFHPAVSGKQFRVITILLHCKNSGVKLTPAGVRPNTGPICNGINLTPFWCYFTLFGVEITPMGDEKTPKSVEITPEWC